MDYHLDQRVNGAVSLGGDRGRCSDLGVNRTQGRTQGSAQGAPRTTHRLQKFLEDDRSGRRRAVPFAAAGVAFPFAAAGVAVPFEMLFGQRPRRGR